jgi:putative membrane protein
MTRGYGDHAANERTFLTWVRTGIAIVVFGFVIEKFNLSLLMKRRHSERTSGDA